MILLKGIFQGFQLETEVATRGILCSMVFLKISQNSRENTCARISFFNKVAGWSSTLLKKRLWHSCFPVNFAKFLRTPFLQKMPFKIGVLKNFAKFTRKQPS